jgi:hypothetical protein
MTQGRGEADDTGPRRADGGAEEMLCLKLSNLSENIKKLHLCNCDVYQRLYIKVNSSNFSKK